ncbi:MAG: prepilin peptidase [Acidobacteria bacterium]|nr:prepilin peptidase [Acidobacteriota bacterium]
MDIQSLAQLSFWLTSLIVCLLGLAVGSFVNVVIYRVPREMSIVAPRSHCPSCGTPIRPRDNIPLLSFLWLKAKCRACGARIPLRYPVVELILCLLFWILWRVEGMSWLLLFDWAFVSAMVALAVIDLEHRLLPDRITYPGFVLAVGIRGLLPQEAALPWASLSGSHALWIGAGLIASSGFIMLAIEWLDYYLIGRRTEDEEEPSVPSEASSTYGRHLGLVTLIMGIALAGIFLLVISRLPYPGNTNVQSHVMSVLGSLASAAVGAGIIWGLRLAYFAVRKLEGAGFGDVKMMMMVGAYLGWARSFLTLLLASVLGSMIGLVAIIRHRNRYVAIPYGIFIAVAAITSLLIGMPLVRWYWGIYQP